MIDTKRYGDHLVFLCTDESEWKDLTSKGNIVFHKSETDLIGGFPDLFDTEFWEAVFRIKKAVPTFRILRVGANHERVQGQAEER